MALADRNTIERLDIRPGAERFRTSPEVIFEILPIVATVGAGAERGAGIVAAVDHAILTARVAGHAINDAVFCPIHLCEHFLVMPVVAVGHEVARRFPAFDVPGRNGPGGASHLTLAGEEFLIDRRAENGEPFAPFLDLCEFLARHFARQEEIFRLFV